MPRALFLCIAEHDDSITELAFYLNHKVNNKIYLTLLHNASATCKIIPKKQQALHTAIAAATKALGIPVTDDMVKMWYEDAVKTAAWQSKDAAEDTVDDVVNLQDQAISTMARKCR